MRRSTFLFLTVGVLLCAHSISTAAYATQTATIILHPGENWIAPPLVPIDASPSSVFAGCNIEGNLTRFDAPSQQTITYTSADAAAFRGILLGDGYKINYSGSTPMTISYAGLADGVPDSQGNMVNMWVTLSGNKSDSENAGGMNWFGHPFNHNTPFDSLLVTDGVEALTIMQAINRGWIDEFWRGFDAETQTGFSVGFSASGADQDYLRAGQMYEVVTHVDDLALVIPPTACVPEPSSVLALFTGLAGIGGMAIRKRN